MYLKIEPTEFREKKFYFKNDLKGK